MPPRRDKPAGRAPERDVEQAILDAVEHVLDAQPFERVSVAQLIQAAGVSRGTFYFYFESKYAVLAAVFERILDQVYDVFTGTWLAHDAAAARPALRKALNASYELFLSHGPLLRAIADSWNRQPELEARYRQMISRLIDGAAAQIDRDRAAGIAPPGPDSRALAAAMIWMNERCFYVDSMGWEPAFRSDAKMVDALADVWARTIYGER